MLQKLSLYQFKNYSKREFDFSKSICCFYGPNGSGKTNILDAIFYLCFTKSYFSSYDHQTVQHNKKGMFVKGQFADDTVDCIIRENGKKEIKHNQVLYEKNSLHIGKFPAVIISPDDTIIINGHSDVRRRFIDILLSQLDPTYLANLITYNKYLAQRNALLKQSKTKSIDAELHNHYKSKLSEFGNSIFGERKKMITKIKPIVQDFYNQIAQSEEAINIDYKSQLQENNLEALLKQSAEKDFITQRTNVGIHKDDLVISLDNLPMKQHASQGQKKSVLFAIKLAEFTILQEVLKKKPILLLDDIFEKLDESRAQYLVDLIGKLDAQIFITDTHESRLKEAFKNQLDNIQFEEIA